MGSYIILFLLAVFFIFFTLIILLSRYKKCPSDRIMVIYGKTKERRAARCIHGGAAFIMPVIQDYGFMSLRPMQIEVNLTNALCKQNIRINVPSVFTVGISTNPELMNNAAERLFGLHPDTIADLAKDIIFGQLRLVIASMTIEEINADRDSFLKNIEQNVAEELNKLGLQLLNVNITDITDESGYITAIGKKAAAEAVNEALIDVANAEKKGQTGQAVAKRDQRVLVSKANAEAAAGEASADRDRRIAIKQAEAEAINGENLSAIEIAKSNAIRAEQEAEAFRKAEAAKRIAQAQIEKAEYEAELEAQKSRAKMEMEKQNAEIIVPSEIQKKQIEIAAEAEAEKYRREAKGEADAIFAKLSAQAKGQFEILKSKGAGFQEIIKACNGDTDAASKMLLIEKLEEIVKLQTEAIKNIKIDKVTVWDGGQRTPDGKTSTANFLSGMMQSLPPLHDVASMAGIDLPGYLGKVKECPANQSITNDKK
ncbi:MAG TPA: SPFH domain-containing protein [Victivallales bacterium]|nr:SPFH domain-containing protein [Victivallales bacterium]HPO89650.1 SPFH domain-containing protein [Victivallales bacterium]HRR05872.1 SPFH domain-containing protein [Victivallales bacterium]HRR27786.1 SPFH domain-containing protein [Victivallales bacterium]HRU01995.1 SPFH domain-containing protein [Victivallales bacterium]